MSGEKRLEGPRRALGPESLGPRELSLEASPFGVCGQWSAFADLSADANSLSAEADRSRLILSERNLAQSAQGGRFLLA